MNNQFRTALMLHAFHRIEGAWVNLETDGMSESDEHQFGWQPFPARMFLDILVTGHQILGAQKKFLDIGCGIGTKVMLADVLFEAEGFDISEEYLDLARRFGCNVFHADCLTFDRYGDYDFLYFFFPFEDHRQKQLEELIYEQMKTGALVAPVSYSEDRVSALSWDDLPGMRRVCDNVYIKDP